MRRGVAEGSSTGGGLDLLAAEFSVAVIARAPIARMIGVLLRPILSYSPACEIGDFEVDGVCALVSAVVVLRMGLARPIRRAARALQRPCRRRRGEWRKLEPVPSRFSRVTDKLGCRWGLNASGDVGLSNSADQRPNAFERGAVLSINGAEFKASEAEVNEGSHYFRVRGTADGLNVTREIWIDPERGGARFIETIANTGSEEKKAQVRLTTAFGEPFAAAARWGRTVADVEGSAGARRSSPLRSSRRMIREPASSGSLRTRALKKSPRSIQANRSSLHSPGNWRCRRRNRFQSCIGCCSDRGSWRTRSRATCTRSFASGRLLRPKVGKETRATLVNFSGSGRGRRRIGRRRSHCRIR